MLSSDSNATYEFRLDQLAARSDLEAARVEVARLLEDAAHAGAKRAAARAALWLAEFKTSMFEFDLALEMCSRVEKELEGIDAPVERARLVLARTNALVDATPDGELLKDALTVLENHGSWMYGSCAAALIANALAARGSTALARHYYVRAVGAAEAAGLQIRGPSLLRALASAEIRDGRPAEGEQLLLIALRRLKPVHMLQARHEEARCVECLGDAVQAQNRIDEARSFYKDALDHLESLDAGGSDRVLKKIAALS